MNSLVLMAADSASSASLTSSLIMFALIILIFYFLIYRPQKKRDKEAKAMLAAMKKGDKVVTIGGIHGTIVTVKDKTVVIKVDDSARIEFSKEAISSVISKDAVKTAPENSKKDKKAVEAKAETPIVEEKAQETEEKTEENK
ncbi:MAG: preprotein translocase subunit YajC [Candidatus Ornithospirochaeta sp.]